MKALITGITGFVGQYLMELLLDKGIEVIGITRRNSTFFNYRNHQVPVYHLELSDSDIIFEFLQQTTPDYLFHLAGQSNVKKSWEDKAATFYANVNQTIYLLDACVKYQEINPNFRILTVGSAEEYGKVNPEELPITEETPLRPLSPYGASKAAVSMLIKQYHKAYGLSVVHARPFNHIGPRQDLGFVVPDFASQIVEIEQGAKEPVMYVGNLKAIRDFTDVRDIVAAYHLLITKGQDGEVYNVCSGQGQMIEELLFILIQQATTSIEVKIDSSRLRPAEIPEHVGSQLKIQEQLGWSKHIPIQTTLVDVLREQRDRVALREG